MNNAQKEQLQAWISKELKRVLKWDSADDLPRYIASMQSENDVEEYCRSLLDLENADHIMFYTELLSRWKELPGDWGSGQEKGSVKCDSMSSLATVPLGTNKDELLIASDAQLSLHNTKKKTKYVNLYSQEGQNKDIILLKGRHRCDCQASKHNLINNCIKCGRIVCQQEGAGPCFFCNSLVCSPEELKTLSRNTKQSENLKKKLMKQPRPEELEKAEAQRNKLLEYDRTSERRTQVIDDDSDYYSVNSVWLSHKERDTMKKRLQAEQARKHASRRDARFTLDFAGRQVVEETSDLGAVLFEDQALREVHSECREVNIDPAVRFPSLNFEESCISKKLVTSANECDSVPQRLRVQDQEFLKIADMGKCLSMHQPWASYLLSGIKLHEGRNWYTSHRGRLWIAAAAKQPDPKLVSQLENTYRILTKDAKLRFPEHLPTSCLLGCVTLVDCLSQEEYRKMYPNGDSDSPFVFVCQEPLELPISFPIQGQHKIYHLDTKIHSAALKSLQRIARIRSQKS